MRDRAAPLWFALILTTSLLFPGCAAKYNSSRGPLAYDPVPAVSVIPADATIEVRHTLSAEVYQIWKDWLNPDSFIEQWKRSVENAIAYDFIESHVFKSLSRDTTAPADLHILVESREHNPGKFLLTVNMSVIDLSTSEVIAEYSREANFTGGVFSYSSEMKSNLKRLLSSIRDQMISDLRDYKAGTRYAARQNASTGTGTESLTAKGVVSKRTDTSSHRRSALPDRTSRTNNNPQKNGPGGYYLLEEAVDFNVLDSVFFDPGTGQITLSGHRDPRYNGPRIPYLQHLAVLLENTSPEFTLEWTPGSERKVDAFLRRMDSVEEMRKVIEEWTDWFTSDGRVTAQGRIMLPLFGVRPAGSSGRPGYLGADTRLVKLQGYGQKLPITRIAPGSPAERAGLRVNDEIIFIGSEHPYHPMEVKEFVRRAGAGTRTRIRVSRPGAGEMDVHAILGDKGGDAWNGLSRFDMLVQIYEAAGMNREAYLLESFNRFQKLMDTEVAVTVLWDIIMATDNYNTVNEMRSKIQSGGISRYNFNKKLFRLILEGTDRIFGIDKLASVYDNALYRGKSPEQAFDSAYQRLDTYIQPSFRQALQKLYRSRDEIVMPLSIVESTLVAKPKVIPEYIGVDSGSRLAKVMFEADYLGKSLINKPELKEKIPDYETQFSFHRDRPGVSGSNGTVSTGRLWFTIGGADLARSMDGKTLDIRGIDMRFNIETKGRGAASVSEAGDAYAELLTSIYDDLATEFPALHELREAAKLALAAEWITSREPGFRMPVYGREAWDGPDEVPGVVYLIWSPRDIKVEMLATGGVSLDPSGEVSDEKIKSSASLPFDSTGLVRAPESVLGSLSGAVKIPGPAVPEPAGWSTKGGREGEETSSVSVVPGRGAPAAVQNMTIGNSLEEEALLLWNTEDLERAAEAYMDIISREKDPVKKASVMLTLAQVQKDMGDEQAALQTLEAALGLASDEPQLQAMLQLMYAKALEERGDRRGAIEALRGYLLLHPGNKAAADLLAELEKDPAGVHPPAVAAGGGITLKGNQAFKQGVSILLEGGFHSSGFDVKQEHDTMTEIPVPEVKGAPLRTYAPVPDTVPALITNHSRYEKASKSKQFRAISKERSELIEEQNEIRLMLKGISAMEKEGTAGKETVTELKEKYIAKEKDIKARVRDKDEEMMNFVVTFTEEDQAGKQTEEKEGQ